MSAAVAAQNNASNGDLRITVSLSDSPRALRKRLGISSAGSVTVTHQPGQPTKQYTVVRDLEQVDGNPPGGNLSVKDGSWDNLPNALGTISIGDIPTHCPNGTKNPHTHTSIPQKPLIIPNSHRFQINVQNCQDNKKHPFLVNSFDLVEDLMKQVAKYYGISVSELSLICNGTYLQKGKTLEYYDVTKGCTIQIPQRNRGG